MIGRRLGHRNARIAWFVALALFAIYVAVSRAQVKSYDGSIMVNLATRILTKHTFTVDPARDSLHLQSPHTSYGFGTTLLVLPFDAVQRAVHARGASILTLANPAVLAACGAVIVIIGQRLGWRRWICAATGLGFGILTTALWQSTEMMSEPGVALCSLLIVLGVLMWADDPDRASLLVGLGVAIAILFRPDSVVLVAPLALAVFWLVPRAAVFTRRTLGGLIVPVAAVGAFQLWYDQYRYGSILQTGFSQQARGQGFSTPVLQGLDLLLRSPGRGFFWSSPILLLAIPGIVFLYRQKAPIAIVIGLTVTARFLYFAHWFIPGGGVAWGPRLLFPVTALLALPAGQMLQYVSDRPSARQRLLSWSAVGGLALISASVSGLSVAIGYEQYWNQWTRVPHSLAAQRGHSYYWSLAHNPIAGNIHLLRIGYPVAPMHFQHGADAVALIALACAAGAIAMAFLTDRRASDPQRGPSTRSTVPAQSAAEHPASR